MPLLRQVFVLCVVAVVASTCGGGGGDGTGPPTLTSVTVAGDSTVVLNGTRSLTATALAGSQQITTGVTYTWSSSTPAIASVTGSGATVTINGVARGSATITVQASTASQPSGPSAQHALRVRIGSIAISPAAPSMASLGETVALAAQGKDANSANVAGINFTFLSRATGVASVTATGTATADLVAVANGSARIVATGDGVSDSVTATVLQVATTLNIVQTDTTVDRIGASFTPTVQATDGRGNPVSGAAIALVSRNLGVATVNMSGVVTSVNEGFTYVVATSGSLADSVLFTVTLVYGSVNITADTTIRRLNGTRQMAAQVRDVGNTVVPSPEITWSLLRNSIAGTTINASGLVTAGGTTGTDSVIATARTVSDMALLRVTQVTARVDVTPNAPANLNFVGDTGQFAAQAFDSGGAGIPGKTFTWSPSNTAVFAVDATGVATAVANGTARVKATVDSRADSVNLTVAQVPVSAALDPSSLPTLTAINDSVRVSCVVRDSATAVIPNHPCNWITGTPGVVTIRPNPADTTFAVAVANGTTAVEARAATGISGFNSILVEQQAAAIDMHPRTIDSSRVRPIGQTIQFTGSAVDANGFPVTSTLSWESDNAALITVNASTGVATSNNVGTTGVPYIRALSGSFKDSARVEVTNTAVTLSGQVQPIVGPTCGFSGCHGPPGTPQQGLDLSTAAQTTATTVNFQAIQSAGLKRVLPTRPDSSYLVHKIQGTHLVPPANGSGSRMPEGCAGASCLTQDKINLIRNWILQGAN